MSAVTTTPVHPAPASAPSGALEPSGPSEHGPQQLLDIATLFAHDTRIDALASICRDQPGRHWFELAAIPAVQVWAIAWPVGTGTGWHDHGVASGAFTVVRGTLTEQSWAGGVARRTLEAGTGRSFGPDHVHDVRNEHSELAISVHAYSPTLTDMTRYQLLGGRLVRLGVDQAGAQW